MAADVPCCEPMFWVYLLMCVGLVSFAGLMSGLTLGLMSLSLVDLEVLVHAGRPQDRKNAAKILPIVKNQHLLLCTLLIGNAMAMEALPIFLDALLPAWGAILISVTLILAFGEIIPQSVCSRYGLAVGAKLSIVVRVIVILLFPIAYPISKLLDLLLGKRHSALLRRDELKMLVNMHGNEAGKGGELTHDETTIIAGALDMTLKTVRDAMTPISKVFSLDISSRLDEKTMGLIISKGHSRVPIYSGESTNIVGLILVKNLIKYSPEDQTLIGDLSIRRIPRVHDCLPLYDMLNQFQKGHSHMAVVVKSKASFGEKLQQEDAKGKYGQFNSHLSSPSVNSHNSINIHCSVVQNEVDPNNNGNNKKMNSQLLNNWERRNGYFSKEELESLPNLEEEVIGIITLEDVMEELLQEEILDETDDYIEAHNRIKINMLTSSPGSVHVSPSYWIGTPLASSPISSCHQTPLSSYDHTPILRSPFSPYIQSPLIARPSLCASPGIPIGNHPRIFPGSHRRSG